MSLFGSRLEVGGVYLHEPSGTLIFVAAMTGAVPSASLVALPDQPAGARPDRLLLEAGRIRPSKCSPFFDAVPMEISSIGEYNAGFVADYGKLRESGVARVRPSGDPLPGQPIVNEEGACVMAKILCKGGCGNTVESRDNKSGICRKCAARAKADAAKKPAAGPREKKPAAAPKERKAKAPAADRQSAMVFELGKEPLPEKARGIKVMVVAAVRRHGGRATLQQIAASLEKDPAWASKMAPLSSARWYAWALAKEGVLRTAAAE